MSLALEKLCKVDQDLNKTVWEGKIPLCIQLTKHFSRSLKGDVSERSLVIRAPRIFYFSMLNARVTQLLLQCLEKEPSGQFFVFEWKDKRTQTALPIHYSIGLLYDLCDGNLGLPWVLEVTAIEQSLEDPLKWTHELYNSLIKEADYAQHSSSKRVLNLSTLEQEQLWSSIVKHEYASFAPIAQKICAIDTVAVAIALADGSEISPLLGVSLPKSIPCRWYFSSKSQKSPFKYVQISIVPVRESPTPDDVFVTAKDGLRSVLLYLNQADGVAVGNCTLKTHGISVPLNTPLIWLYLNFSLPDLVLHIKVDLKT